MVLGIPLRCQFQLFYNPQNPVILSPSVSHWARGIHIEFCNPYLRCFFSFCITHSHRDLNTMLVPNESLVYLSREELFNYITASNPVSSVNQSHELK